MRKHSCLVVLLASLSACAKSPPAAPNQAPVAALNANAPTIAAPAANAPTANAPTTNAKSDPNHVAAFNHYVNGFNRLIDQERFMRGYPNADAPLVKAHRFGDVSPRADDGLERNALTAVTADFTAAKQMWPDDNPFAAPADALVASFGETLDLLQPAARYYASRDFVHDKGKLGIALDAKIMAAYARYREAGAQFSQAMETREDARDAADVAARANDKNAGYWFRAYDLAARHFLRAAAHCEDRANCTRRLEDVVALSSGLDAFTAMHASPMSNWSGYQTDVHDFTDEAKRFMTVLPKGEHLQMALRVLREKFNRLIDYHNKMLAAERANLPR